MHKEGIGMASVLPAHDDPAEVVAVHRMGLRHPGSDKGGYSRVNVHDGPHLRTDFALRNREQALCTRSITGQLSTADGTVFFYGASFISGAISIQGQSYICRAVSFCGSSLRSSPRNNERHADTPLELRALLAPQRCRGAVAPLLAYGCVGTIVPEEKYQGVLRHSLLF